MIILNLSSLTGKCILKDPPKSNTVTYSETQAANLQMYGGVRAESVI